MESTQQLISGYIDGELTDNEAAQLATSLQTDSVALDRFVFSNFIHSQLLDWMNEPLARDDAVADAAVGRSPFSEFPRSTRLSRFRRHLRTWAALAAVLLVAASIGTAVYVIKSRPVYVGTLTDSTNCRWSAESAKPAVGSFLEDGRELELLTGRAVITFASGAKLLLEAPASVRLDSQSEVHLEAGRIAAKVPIQAIGFTVNSTLARFVDRGTAFALNLNAEESFQLHVFEGMVEVRLDPRFGEPAKRPASIAEVRAIKFDIKSGDLEFMEFEEGKQMPF